MSYVSAAIGIAGLGMGVYQTVKANKDKKKAEADFKAAQGNQPDYQTPQSQKDLLGDTIANRNAVNPALMMAYRQAQQAAAGTQANAQRNATSGAEALAVGDAAQGKLQSILPGLANAQTEFSQQNKGQYYNALNGMSDDERMKFQAKLAKSQDLMNMYLGMIGGANAGKAAGIQNAFGGLATAAGGLKGAKLGGAGTITQPMTQNPSYFMQYPDNYNYGGYA